MYNSIYRVCLDIHTTHSQAQLEVSKNDTAREFEFTLTNNGAVYSIADDCYAIFRAKKPDGTVLFNSCEIVGDRIKYQLTSQTSSSVGIVQCEVELLDGNGKTITSPRFELRVADTIYSDSEVESTDEFTALTEALAKTKGLSGTGYITDGSLEMPFTWTLLEGKILMSINPSEYTLGSVSSLTAVFEDLEAPADLTAYCDVCFFIRVMALMTTLYVGTLKIDFEEGSSAASIGFKDNQIVSAISGAMTTTAPTVATYENLKGKVLAFDYPVGE